ncbi:hypothetical protein EXIGLDRAFT_767047 [Exidia glandulosa HHB12029]|uniref:Mid2 domain-containing protein n=1 Tax=Exidia glandulosa HHB12029 TaxID=1314781 RepID=A0A165J9A5_EXIGL|nr:hypothetical protein EXIGLDRAFT_767047 [Exidia glandulosa HHB12029]
MCWHLVLSFILFGSAAALTWTLPVVNNDVTSSWTFASLPPHHGIRSDATSGLPCNDDGASKNVMALYAGASAQLDGFGRVIRVRYARNSLGVDGVQFQLRINDILRSSTTASSLSDGSGLGDCVSFVFANNTDPSGVAARYGIQVAVPATVKSGTFLTLIDADVEVPETATMGPNPAMRNIPIEDPPSDISNSQPASSSSPSSSPPPSSSTSTSEDTGSPQVETGASTPPTPDQGSPSSTKAASIPASRTESPGPEASTPGTSLPTDTSTPTTTRSTLAIGPLLAAALGGAAAVAGIGAAVFLCMRWRKHRRHAPIYAAVAQANTSSSQPTGTAWSTGTGSSGLSPYPLTSLRREDPSNGKAVMNGARKAEFSSSSSSPTRSTFSSSFQDTPPAYSAAASGHGGHS